MGILGRGAAPCRKAMSRRYNVFCSVGEDHRNDYKVNAGLVIVEHVTGSRRDYQYVLLAHATTITSWENWTRDRGSSNEEVS